MIQTLPKKILVFGKNGQVARALALLSHPSWTFAGRDDADLADASSVKNMLQKWKWDAVINAAAYTAVDKAESEESLAFAVNAEAPEIMAKHCAAQKIPFIHLSTDYVFDGKKSAPYNEEDRTNPLSVYGRTKEAGEKNILNAGGQGVILRTSWVYAPEGKNFLLTMLRLGQQQDELRIVNDQRGAPTSAAMIADAISQILSQAFADRDVAGLFHMTASGNASWYEFAQAIFTIAAEKGLKTPSRLMPITTAEYPTPARRPLNSQLDCTKLADTFGINLPEWRQGLQECMEVLYPSAPIKREATR